MSIAFLFGCSSNKVHEGFITQTTWVGNLFWPSVPSFPTQFVKCFCQELVLKHLLQGPNNFLYERKFMCFFLFCGETLHFLSGHFCPSFSLVFTRGFFFPGLSWFKLTPSTPFFTQDGLTCVTSYWFSCFRILWILGIVKLVKLCVVNLNFDEPIAALHLLSMKSL